MSIVIDKTAVKQKRTKKPQQLLERFYNNENTYEIAIDEVGRGCLFGRVYIACVILPKDPESFCGQDIKDSKKFSSKKKLFEVAEYIKSHAYAWHVTWIDEKTIDEINILQSTMRGMHECIREIIIKTKQINTDTKNTDFMAVIDGNYFNPYRIFDEETQSIYEIPFVTVEQGDAKYMSIAAASILAKTARDEYIYELCSQYPILNERYNLESNVGYGTKAHLDGIAEFGITQWHRRTFGNACKNAILNEIDENRKSESG
jgi:ribonuclease HII